MKRQISITRLSVCLAFAILTLTPGCGNRSAATDSSNLSIDDRIKSVEKSDLPGPVNEKAIQELQAKQQGQAGTTK